MRQPLSRCINDIKRAERMKIRFTGELRRCSFDYLRIAQDCLTMIVQGIRRIFPSSLAMRRSTSFAASTPSWCMWVRMVVRLGMT